MGGTSSLWGNSFVSGFGSFVVTNDFGVLNRPVTVFITSASGVVLRTVDDFIRETTGKDIAVISAFRDQEEEKGESNKDFILRNYRATDELWGDLNKYLFKVVTVNGFWRSRNIQTKEKEGGGVEKSFMLINADPALKTEVFFDIVKELVKKYDQDSGLIKPARNMSFGGQDLEAEMAYYVSPSGKTKKLGSFRKVVGDPVYTPLDDQPKLEATGGSQTFGEGEKFVFSGLFWHGLDFSRLAGRPSPTTERGRIRVFSWLEEEYSNGGVIRGRERPPSKSDFDRREESMRFWDSVEQGKYVFPGSADARRRLVSGARAHSKSRRGLRSDLSYADFDQWEGAINIFCSLGIRSLRSWLVLQGYSEDAERIIMGDLQRTLFHTVPGSEPITSTIGPRSLAAWSLYEKAQKLKAGGLSYKETVNLLAREVDILPKEVKDIIGTSSEWAQGVFDYGLEPLHPDEAEAIQSQKDREFEEETWQIYSAVVAKQDPIRSRFVSGQINLVGAIDELMELGMGYEEAEEIANSWLPKSLFES